MLLIHQEKYWGIHKKMTEGHVLIIFKLQKLKIIILQIKLSLIIAVLKKVIDCVLEEWTTNFEVLDYQ